MKRFFTLIIVVVLATGAQAQEKFLFSPTEYYTDGQVIEASANVTLTIGLDGKLAKKNFTAGETNAEFAQTYTNADGEETTQIVCLTGGNNPKDGALDGASSTGISYKPESKNNPQSGTFFVLSTKQAGSMTAGIILNSGKSLYVTKSDGTALATSELTLVTPEGKTVELDENNQSADKFYGLVSFKAEAGESYYLFCTGSKICFYGYIFTPEKGGGTTYLTCPDDHHPHLVDLGLPSGTKWSCCNVDTDHPENQSPTNYGGYYAWGETETKSTYNWSTYIHCRGSYDTCKDLGSDIAGTEYDVAHVKWGGSWVMPSKEQQDELRNNCTYEWTTVDGVLGGKYTSNINGSSVFLPAAGCRDDSDLYYAGSDGYYWSSTQYPSRAFNACDLYFGSGLTYWGNSGRFNGHGVRPVCSAPKVIAFSDAIVKSLCVKNWDTNGDGELSFSEAASITSLGTVFRFNESITSFDELKYFTGLESIGKYAFDYCHNLTSIIIPNSVTDIGDNAFWGCSGLSSITIPNSVTSIGDFVCYGCSNLTSINIPNSVTRIGKKAFSYCASLKSANIGNSVISIRDSTFFSCESLKSVTIGNNVTSIGEGALGGCSSLTSVTIPNSVTSIGKDAFHDCTGLNSIIIGNNVKSIGNLAFSCCSSLASVTIPNSVERIGDYAFECCTGMSSLTIGSGVTSIGKWAFILCENLTKVNILDIAAWCRISFDKEYDDSQKGYSTSNPLVQAHNLYLNDELVTNLVLPNNVTTIGDDAFNYCTSLTSITIPNSVTNIGNYAFSGCGGLAYVTIGSNVTRIGDFTYSGCTNLISIIVDANNPNYDSRDNCNAIIKTSSNKLVIGCKNTVIPISVTSIEDYAFYQCADLTDITIPENVTHIGRESFFGCGLKSVTVRNPIPVSIYQNTFSHQSFATLYVPFGTKKVYQTAAYWKEFKNIIEIDNSEAITFADATVKSICVNNWDTNSDGELSQNEAAAVSSLDTVFKSSKITSFNELQYFTGLTYINEGAFSNSTIKEVTLPETIKSLGQDAFLYCKSLLKIHLPASLETIEFDAIVGCSNMTSITVAEGNKYFCDIDGVLFSKDKTILLQFPPAKATNYIVPEGTKVIGTNSFFFCKLLTVTLPKSLVELGYDAFGFSPSLTELSIPDGVKTIGDYILDGCKKVTKLCIPQSVTKIGQNMTRGCNAITDVYCDLSTPFAIEENNFTSTTYANATLHVLPYLVDTYKNLEGWKYFANIKGDVIDYAVTAEATTINLGETAILPVLVANNGEIDGMQFDFTLPAGVTVAADMVGGFVVTTTDRSNKLTATCAKIADNTYRAILLSIDRAIVAAGEGAVLNIHLQCADDATGGEYKIAFTNVSVSRVEGDKSVNVKVADFTAPLTIVEISKIPGDVDGNFTVDVTDVMIIVDYILNRPCNKFNFANADLDGDGIVNVTDAMNVVNIILHKSNARISPTAMLLARDLLRLGTSETGCQLHTAFDAPTVTALQMEVTLPEGCRLNNVFLSGKAARSHMVKAYQQSDRTYNVVVFSIKGSALDTDAPFLQLDLEGNGGLVEIENILCTDTSHESLTSPNLSAEVTGITTAIADNSSDTPVYNLAGQRLERPRKGINITNGKKMVVK